MAKGKPRKAYYHPGVDPRPRNVAKDVLAASEKPHKKVRHLSPTDRAVIEAAERRRIERALRKRGN